MHFKFKISIRTSNNTAISRIKLGKLCIQGKPIVWTTHYIIKVSPLKIPYQFGVHNLKLFLGYIFLNKISCIIL